MTTRSNNVFVRFFAATGRFLDRLRRIMHFIVLLLLFAFLLALIPRGHAPLPASVALVIAPEGPLVDQLAGDPLSRAFDELAGRVEPQTLVRDLVEAIDTAREDERVAALYLDLDRMVGAGLPKLERVAVAIDEFRAAGKRVVASGDFFTQPQYYLAARADEVYLHPSGFVFMQGFGRYRMYYADAIDKLSIDWNVFRVGEYKSFVEPYTRNDMSAEDKASSREWLGQLWGRYLDQVAAARNLSADDLRAFATDVDDRVAARDGDLARAALDAGLVDELWHRDQVRQRLIELVGEDREHNFAAVGHAEYLVRKRSLLPDTDPVVGVIVASGEILDGRQPPGRIGGDTLGELISDARHDESVRAVVLQVDSPGGSKFASEVIQRELRALKDAGKPLVVSMSGVAASGGYWIAMDADEIWAHPATITGSIGIGAFFPTVQRTMDRLGVHTDGIGTTEWAGEFRPDRPLGDGAKRILQLSIEHGYRQFVSEVARARGMSEEAVDRVARGRVWTGADAQRIGLIDNLGGLDAAIAAAAARVGLDPATDVRFLEKELSFRESVSLMLATRVSRIAGRVPSPGMGTGVTDWLARLRGDLERLSALNDPAHVYALCFCTVD